MKTKVKLLLCFSVVIALLSWFTISHGASYLHIILTVGGGIALTLFGESNQTIGLAAGAFALVVLGALFAGFGAGFLPGVAVLVAGILSAVGCAAYNEG